MSAAPVQISIVMPYLNEAETLAGCLVEARAGIARAGVPGEIIVADNGSTDGSQQIALDHGARLIQVAARGYGSALRAGISAARGEWIFMGDSDLSYDFSNLNGFIAKLREEKADLVMGCRMPIGGGTIDPGAMPTLNRYLGNPVLSWIGRLLFSSRITDFHCGMRAFRKDAYERMDLTTTGMEFASEMVVKTAMRGMRVAEVPITLRKDGRSRPPHLRRWRDGWRHLRFMLLFSPRWIFFYPGFLAFGLGVTFFVLLALGPAFLGRVRLDIGSLTVAGLALNLGFQLLSLGVLGRAYAGSQGLMPESPRVTRLLHFFSLEKGIVLGLSTIGIGAIVLGRVVWDWAWTGWGELPAADTARATISSACLLYLGSQIIFTSFFVSLFELKTAATNDWSELAQKDGSLPPPT